MRHSSNQSTNLKHQRHLRKRYNADFRFMLYGIMATGVTLLCLGWVIFTICKSSSGALWQVQIQLEVPAVTESAMGNDSVERCLDHALEAQIKTLPPGVAKHVTVQTLRPLFGKYAAYGLCAKENNGGQKIWVAASAEGSDWWKKHLLNGGISPDKSASHPQHTLLKSLASAGQIREVFNWHFFTMTDSREAEHAGILAALIGSFYTLLVCMAIAFPLGVATAIYLEEFAGRSRWAKLIELNIQNLTAVPSIIFGVLGLSIYLLTLHLPRSSSLVGGMTLALMVLPIIVTTTRQALSVVPTIIREGVIALGATRLQLVMDHLIPLALPGILTGTILSICRALGETAPLLLMGMVAFIVSRPHTLLEPATVLPVQVYLWSDAPESAFIAKTSAAILVLLLFLLLINLFAIVIRKKYSVKY